MEQIYEIDRRIDRRRHVLKLIKDVSENNEQYQKTLDIVPISAALFVIDNAGTHIRLLPRQ